MTASANDNPTETPAEKKDPPRAFDILLYAAVLTKRHAADIYGFTAYLLFPLLLFLGVRNIPGTVGTVSVIVVNALALVIFWWACASICTLVSIKTAHPKKDHDMRSVGMHAADIVKTLLLTVLLSSLLQAAGFILFIIPGILATILLTFAFEEVVLRGAGPLSALAASKARVQGNIRSVGWQLLIIFVAALLIYTALGSGILLFIAGIFHTDVAVLLSNTPPLWAEAILSILQIALIPPVVIAHTVLYLSTGPTVE